MVFQVKQKLFSLGDKFTIRDRDGLDCFQVQGKVLSLGAKLSFQDMMGHELYYIEQQLLRLLAEYRIYQNGNVLASCQQKFSLLGSKFEISSQKGHYTIVGQPLNYNYEILKDGQRVAIINKQFFSFSDTYGVEIEATEEEAFILSLVIVIDQVVHNNENN